MRIYVLLNKYGHKVEGDEVNIKLYKTIIFDLKKKNKKKKIMFIEANKNEK